MRKITLEIKKTAFLIESLVGKSLKNREISQLL